MASVSPFDSGRTLVFKTMSTEGSKPYLNCSPAAPKSTSAFMGESIGFNRCPGTHWQCTKQPDGTYQLQTLSTSANKRYLDSSSSAPSDESVYLVETSTGKPGSSWVPTLLPDGSYTLASQTSGSKHNLTCNLTASKKDSIYLSSDTGPVGTHWKVGVDYYTQSQVQDIIHGVYTSATITSYLSLLIGKYGSLDFDLLHDIWRESKLSDYVQTSKKFDNDSFAICLKGEVAKYSYRQRFPDNMASLCGIMWGVNGAFVTAFNFTIDPFGNLILFDPVKGEQIPHDRYSSVEFCMV